MQPFSTKLRRDLPGHVEKEGRDGVGNDPHVLRASEAALHSAAGDSPSCQSEVGATGTPA